MKLLRETLIIILIYFVGEVISKYAVKFIPGNIIGMIILLVLLSTKVMKLEKVETVSKFLLDHLAFFFVPAGVGLLSALDVLNGNILKILVICIVSTFIVMGVTGKTVDMLIKKR